MPRGRIGEILLQLNELTVLSNSETHNAQISRSFTGRRRRHICLEAQAKLHIQDMIRQSLVELVTSFVLDFENSNNRSMPKRMAIEKFMKDYATLYVSNKHGDQIAKIADSVMETGVKEKDAYHVACAIMADCDYFVTTDDRLLKYQSEKINLVTPEEFIRRMEVDG